MLYNQSKEKELTQELFKNPTKEYRGAPFWAWNGKLSKEELLHQIDVLKEMGFGGFYMHTRVGLEIPYLGEEFMGLVKSCVEHADQNEMLACLYDEDKWPSGYGGGAVTKERKYRRRSVLFTKTRQESFEKDIAFSEGKTYFLSSYDIKLNPCGEIISCKEIGEDEEGQNKWYAYCIASKPDFWTNYQGYVDVFSKEATKAFLESTHEKYKECVGEYFGSTVPTIFTDEPNFTGYNVINDPFSQNNSSFAWSYDMKESFENAKGYDIVPNLPYLIWQGEKVNTDKIRHDYFEHITERFITGYFDTINDWCISNNIEFTGHILCESGINQARSVGEAMHIYKSFGVPGLDILCDRFEYDSAKQVQSVAHQLGKIGVMSEMYGVVNYDFDFRGFKRQGDWQAALGVTHRVPHLSWVTMKGVAKRDYPASINYQSPWYKEYGYIENHFARVNTALTRGKPIIRLGVMHPIESIWKDNANNRASKGKLDCIMSSFQKLTTQLLEIAVDFNYISESLLDDLYENTDSGFRVGEMTYQTILLPEMTSIRQSTLDKLNYFVQCGGEVFYIGTPPEYTCDGDIKQNIYENFKQISQNNYSISMALENVRDISIYNKDYQPTDNLCYQLRQDGDRKWLFVAHFKNECVKDDTACQECIIKVKGEYCIKLYDTLNGEIQDIAYEVKDGNTYIFRKLYLQDSILLALDKYTGKVAQKKKKDKECIREITIFDNIKYSREEDNSLCLDLAHYSYDGVTYSDQVEELVRIDQFARTHYNYTNYDPKGIQPYLMPISPISEYVWLKFKFNSEIEYNGAELALEFHEDTSVYFNGENIPVDIVGYFVDRDIKKIKLGKILKGINELTVKAPIGERATLERYFILGNFDVELKGIESTIKSATKIIPFDTITRNGMPFYSGNITYETEFELKDGEDKVEIILNKYLGVCVNVYVDDKYAGKICFAPYNLNVDNLSSGKHNLKFKLFAHRHNAFGSFHASDKCYSEVECGWFGPESWETKGSEWCYNYNLRDIGIMSLPIIRIIK